MAATIPEPVLRWPNICVAGMTGRCIVIVGMKQAKDAAEFLRPLLPLAATAWAVCEPDQHAAMPVDAIVAASNGVARPGPRVQDALRAIPRTGGPARVLICGSLYLAGEVLQLDQRSSR